MVNNLEILIAESSPIIRAGVVSIIERCGLANLTITELTDASTLLAGGYKVTPDIVVVNSLMLGFSAPAQLKTATGNDELKVVALQTTLIEQSQLQNYDEVISMYDSTETIKTKLLSQIQDEQELDNKKELSQREKEIIVCVVKGMTNKVIAETLYISTHTVIAHRRNIANKLKIHSPAGLTIFAIVNKLVDLSEIKNSISKAEIE